MDAKGPFRAEESRSRLSAFLEVLRAMMAETELDRLLGLLAREAPEVLEAEESHLFLVEREKGELYSQPPWGPEARFPIGQGIAGQVAASGQILNLAEGDLRPPLEVEGLESLPKTLLSVPLKDRRGEVLGVLQVLEKREGPFSREDERLLSILASQAAIVMENFQLDRSLRASLERVSKLLAVSRAINAEMDLDSLLAIIAESASALLRADRSTIFLIDRTRGELWSRIALGLDSQEIRLKMDQGIAGEVVSSGRTINIQDAYRDPRFNREVDQRTGYRTQTILCMPMRNKRGEIIGAFQVLNKKGGTFTKEDEGLLDAFSSQAGIALENAQLFEEVKKAYAELKELDQMKSNFLAAISHELRTPLTPIMGYVETMLSGGMGPLSLGQQRGLEVVTKCVERLKVLIEDLLTFVHMERGTIDLQRQGVDPSRLIRKWAEVFSVRAREKGLDLKLEIHPDLPEVWADEKELGKALSLLLDNALKFTPTGGQVRLAAHLVHGSQLTVDGKEGLREPSTVNRELHRDFVEILVRDTGIGIPATELPRIFDRFYQVDSSPTRKFGGTGLGLALVKQIIEAHGSQVFVESEEGKGTTFRFYLPV